MHDTFGSFDRPEDSDIIPFDQMAKLQHQQCNENGQNFSYALSISLVKI